MSKTPTWRIALTTIGDAEVSTVQIANDDDRHGFETMIFGGKHDQEQEHYTTKVAAEAGHKRWVAVVRTEATS